MINYLTRLKVADNCGAREVQCIKVLGGSFIKRAIAGGLLVIVVKRHDPAKRKYSRGLITRGVVVRACNYYLRGCGLWVRFNQNAVVVVNKKSAPAAKRLRGPMVKEVCIQYNFLGTVTRFLV